MENSESLPNDILQCPKAVGTGSFSFTAYIDWQGRLSYGLRRS